MNKKTLIAATTIATLILGLTAAASLSVVHGKPMHSARIIHTTDVFAKSAFSMKIKLFCTVLEVSILGFVRTLIFPRSVLPNQSCIMQCPRSCIFLVQAGKILPTCLSMG
jgi:hypothetical protein